MTYITVTDVRIACGIPSSLATDSQIEHAITIVEDLTARVFNTRFEPTKNIDILDGTGTNSFFTDKNPVLSVDALKSDGDTVDISALDIRRESGQIVLGQGNDTNIFVEKTRSIVVKYTYGFVEEDHDSRTTTSGAVTSGSSVVVTVNDASSFATDEWVRIIGMDGNDEVAKITGISSSDITVDNLNFSHEDGSVFTKLEIPNFIKRFMELEATIYAGMNAIGATYTFNASYSLGDLNIQKGVPYTHWKESLQKAIKEREGLRNKIKPRFKII